MTFKHVKFADSPTMRALEKVAQEKGLIKPQPMQKIAMVKKADIAPTANLTENILKLCAGLREQGFVKDAADLEADYLNYKQAQTLYEAHKEKGEDVINFAHPGGSHKLEGVEGAEATFENILDKHTKFLEVAQKVKPTGKLSEAKSILKEVKLALAQSTDVRSLLNEAYSEAYAAYQVTAKAGGITGMVLDWVKERIGVVHDAASKSPEELTLNDVDDAVDALNAMARNLHPNILHNIHILPHFLNKGISDDKVWGQINDKIQSALKLCERAADMVKNQALSSVQNDNPNAESKSFQTAETTVSADPTIAKLVALTNKLKAYLSIGSIARNATAKKWVSDEIGEIRDVMTRYNSIPEGQEGTVKSSFEKEVAEKESEVNQFAQTWIGQA
jgi:hypothetical protein